jgi:hypothetical protein
METPALDIRMGRIDGGGWHVLASSAVWLKTVPRAMAEGFTGGRSSEGYTSASRFKLIATVRHIMPQQPQRGPPWPKPNPSEAQLTVKRHLGLKL